MSEIIPPREPIGEAGTAKELLVQIDGWYTRCGIEAENRSLSAIWYRGIGKPLPSPLLPGIYRDGWAGAVKAMYGRNDHEAKRLSLEREMLREYRTTGARYFNPNNVTEVYFVAQHFGMPTRLLDWTTNPLAAAFFAVCDVSLHDKADGELFMMDATRLLHPERHKSENKDKYPLSIQTMRDYFIEDAIGESFWHPMKKQRERVIVPVRPDNMPGRIGQQNSCFTLHMHQSPNQGNKTLAKIVIPKGAKGVLFRELRRMNVTKFTIYDDLDSLAVTIKDAWRRSAS